MGLAELRLIGVPSADPGRQGTVEHAHLIELSITTAHVASAMVVT
jgi:hypothetical protein